MHVKMQLNSDDNLLQQYGDKTLELLQQFWQNDFGSTMEKCILRMHEFKVLTQDVLDNFNATHAKPLDNCKFLKKA